MKKISRNQRDFLILAIFILVIFFAFFPFQKLSNPFVEEESPFQPENQVAILDQFHSESPEYSEETRELFANENIGVDIYENIPVNLYRHLPSLGYKIIILRVHSGMRVSSGSGPKISLFTTEEYDPSKYLFLKSNDLLGNAFVYGDNWVKNRFSITPKFIEKEMKGEFDNTLIVINSCNISDVENSSLLVSNFYEKGAKSIVTWDENVTLDHGDRGVSLFLEKILLENETLMSSTNQVQDEIGVGEDAGAKLIVNHNPHSRLKIVDGKILLVE